jgi:hypothetical protein
MRKQRKNKIKPGLSSTSPELSALVSISYKGIECCGDYIKTVSNGIGNPVAFCPRCRSVYAIRLVKIPKQKVSKEFIADKMKEIERGGRAYV